MLLHIRTKYGLMNMPYNSSIRKTGIRRGLGGWGDVVMALAVAELWVKEKGSLVTFGCPEGLMSLGENIPNVEVLPCRENGDEEGDKKEFDKLTFGKKWDVTTPCIEYERALQPNVDRNRTQIWATKLGLKGTPHPRVYLTEEEIAWGSEWVQRRSANGKFKLGIVPKSYAWVRSWRGWIKLIYQLKVSAPDLIPIVFLAEMDSWEEFEFGVCGIPVYRKSIREILSIMNQCDLVVGVDTGPMHSAVGLGIQTIWIFTHIDGKIRTKGYEKAEVVQRDDLECCPCWYEAQCHDPNQYAFCRAISEDVICSSILKYYGG